MVHYLFLFTPKEPKMVLLVSSEILLLHFSTAVRYESVNFFNLIREGLSSDTIVFQHFVNFDASRNLAKRCMIIPFEGSKFVITLLYHGFYVDNIILLERKIARNWSKYFVWLLQKIMVCIIILCNQ